MPQAALLVCAEGVCCEGGAAADLGIWDSLWDGEGRVEGSFTLWVSEVMFSLCFLVRRGSSFYSQTFSKCLPWSGFLIRFGQCLALMRSLEFCWAIAEVRPAE